MRNLKKFLALVLAMLMIVSASATVSAFTDVDEDNQYADAIADLVEKEIVNGVGDDKFDPTAGVERFQMALMMARTLNPAETNWQDGMNIFTDVNEWYGAIAYAYMNNIVTGIGGGKFDPHAGIKYQDALIMAVRALGYKVDVTGDPYWLAAYNQAQALGLTENVSVFKGEQALNRAECAQIIYNMLYATPADGGATIAAKNFGEATADNTTMFVITGTSMQAFSGDKVVDGAYVTLQPINIDGTLGDGFFAKFDTLGFGEDVKADDVIGYSVGLVNYADGEYDSAVPGTAEVLYNTDVTTDGSKVTIDGKVYYIVTERSGNPIKNEITIKDDSGKVATTVLNSAKGLYFNKNGDVVKKDGTVLAVKQAVTSSNGQTLYALKTEVANDVFNLYTADELINVKEISDAYNDSTTVNGYSDVKSLTGTYQLTVFDDNGDGKYDRAITTPVYMTVYTDPNSDKKETVYGPAGLDAKEVAYTDPSVKVKGTVFVYTYNKQTKVVNVLDTVDCVTSAIEKINLTASESKNYTITIGGTTYKFAGSNEAAMGAKLQAVNADSLTGDISVVTSKPAIKYSSITSFVDNASIGSAIKFYEYNGYIIYAQAYNVEDKFDLVAIKSITDYDSDAIYADVYVGGKLINDAAISEVLYDGKTVKLSDLNSVRVAQVLRNYIDVKNTIFKGIPLADGSYRIGIELNGMNIDKTPFIYANVTTAVKEGGFGYTKYTINNNKVEFLDGISNDLSTNRIRTNADTVFYFIDKNGNLKVAKTSGADSIIKCDENTKIFVDKLGYTGDFKGTASKVIVCGYTSIEGFGLTSVTNSIVYVPSKVDMSTIKTDLGSASDVGLSSSYTGNYYYYKDVAVNLSNGTKVSVYTTVKLVPGKAYELDEKNVVVNGTGAIDITTDPRFEACVVESADGIIYDDEYVSINGLFGTNKEVTKIMVQDSALAKVDVKSATKDSSAADRAKVNTLIVGNKMYYLASTDQFDDSEGAAFIPTDLKDHIFVAIAVVGDTTTPPAGQVTTGVAKYVGTTTTGYGAIVGDQIYYGTGIKETDIDVEFADGKLKTETNVNGSDTATIKYYVKADGTVGDIPAGKVTVTVTSGKITVAFAKENMLTGNYEAATLPAGQYRIVTTGTAKAIKAGTAEDTTTLTFIWTVK